MKFKIEYWYRYRAGGELEKDFEVEEIEADSYEEACNKIKSNKKRRVFNFKNVTNE